MKPAKLRGGARKGLVPVKIKHRDGHVVTHYVRPDQAKKIEAKIHPVSPAALRRITAVSRPGKRDVMEAINKRLEKPVVGANLTAIKKLGKKFLQAKGVQAVSSRPEKGEAFRALPELMGERDHRRLLQAFGVAPGASINLRAHQDAISGRFSGKIRAYMHQLDSMSTQFSLYGKYDPEHQEKVKADPTLAERLKHVDEVVFPQIARNIVERAAHYARVGPAPDLPNGQTLRLPKEATLALIDKQSLVGPHKNVLDGIEKHVAALEPAYAGAIRRKAVEDALAEAKSDASSPIMPLSEMIAAWVRDSALTKASVEMRVGAAHLYGMPLADTEIARWRQSVRFAVKKKVVDLEGADGVAPATKPTERFDRLKDWERVVQTTIANKEDAAIKVKAMAAVSQALHGSETVAYRGVYAAQAQAIRDALNRGDKEITLRVDQVTSFAEGDHVASKFRDKSEGGVMVRAKIPRSAILFSHRAFGEASHETEIAVVSKGSIRIPLKDIDIGHGFDQDDHAQKLQQARAEDARRTAVSEAVTKAGNVQDWEWH